MQELRSAVTKKVTTIDKKWYFYSYGNAIYSCGLDICAELALKRVNTIAHTLAMRLIVGARAGVTGNGDMRAVFIVYRSALLLRKRLQIHSNITAGVENILNG